MYIFRESEWQRERENPITPKVGSFGCECLNRRISCRTCRHRTRMRGQFSSARIPRHAVQHMNVEVQMIWDVLRTDRNAFFTYGYDTQKAECFLHDKAQIAPRIYDGVSVLQCVAVCCSVLQCAAVCCSVLQCVAVCCSVFQCATECYSVLQYVAVCYSVLQCVAVCCSVLQCAAVCCSVLHSVAVCCSVLQCVAVLCRVVQCVAVCCSVLQCGVVCMTRHTLLHEFMMTWVWCSVLQSVAMCCNVLRFVTPVAGSNLLKEKVWILGTFSRHSCFRILFYCAHSWGCGVDSWIPHCNLWSTNVSYKYLNSPFRKRLFMKCIHLTRWLSFSGHYLIKFRELMILSKRSKNRDFPPWGNLILRPAWDALMTA